MRFPPEAEFTPSGQTLTPCMEGLRMGLILKVDDQRTVFTLLFSPLDKRWVLPPENLENGAVPEPITSKVGWEEVGCDVNHHVSLLVVQVAEGGRNPLLTDHHYTGVALTGDGHESPLLNSTPCRVGAEGPKDERAESETYEEYDGSEDQNHVRILLHRLLLSP